MLARHDFALSVCIARINQSAAPGRQEHVNTMRDPCRAQSSDLRKNHSVRERNAQGRSRLDPGEGGLPAGNLK